MRKVIPAVAVGAAALLVAGSTYAYSALNNNVTLAVDGQDTQVATMAQTVGDLLQREDITVGAHDLVAPSLDSQITDGTKVAVQYGRQVNVTVDGKEQSFWTTATNVDQALQTLPVNTTNAAISTSRSSGIGRDGLDFSVNTEKKVKLTVAGTQRTVKTTAVTVAGMLNDAKVNVDFDDQVSRKTSAKVKNGMAVRVTRVDVNDVTRVEQVRFSTTYKKTSQLDKGKRKVETEGRNGKRRVVYTEVRHDGELVKRTEKSSKTLKRTKTKVVLVGTKDSSGPGGNGVWDRLAQCESGGNWSINTGNGFYGGVQFTAATWHAMGGSGLPHQNSRETQIRIAKKLQARAGWGQWPGCSSKLGLR